jgi:hypothetical protein
MNEGRVLLIVGGVLLLISAMLLIAREFKILVGLREI